MVVIRMARKGRVKRPVYTIVAADSRCSRDGRFLEKLGQYDPLKKDQSLSGLKLDRIEYWLGQGARPSATFNSLMKRMKVQEGPKS